MKKLIIPILLIFMGECLFIGCGKNEEAPTTGLLEGIITDANNGVPLENAQLVVYDANTNAPIGNSVLTDEDGNYNFELVPGTYYLVIYKQGYEKIPVSYMATPIPLNVSKGITTNENFEMLPSSITNAGLISGRVTNNGNPIGGVLVVATDHENGFSTVSDNEGEYVIYNVPNGNYTVSGWIGGFNSSSENVSLTSNIELKDQDLDLTPVEDVKVTGMVSFLATTNIEVDVALTHPYSRETIPGLVTTTNGGSYSINGVPNGTFLARATFENDEKVVDPDWVVKNGEPIIEINGTSIQMDFSVTGSIKLAEPSNEMATTIPCEVTSVTPTFSWQPYSSATDYVIEVMDGNGNIIWGGFSNNWTVKNILIPKEQTSITFNSDGNALADLTAGKLYRWRVYASKEDKQANTGWRLISVSEDQMGLIKILP